MDRVGRRYISYLLRLWRAQGESGPQWRASLQSVQNEEPRAFGSLGDLFAFLKESTRKEDEKSDEMWHEPPTAGSPVE